MRKPKVSSAKWYQFWESNGAKCAYDENNLSFLKLSIPGDRVKYFYGENSHSDAARLAGDKGFNGLWQAIN
jgi:hypothetical protein